MAPGYSVFINMCIYGIKALFEPLTLAYVFLQAI